MLFDLQGRGRRNTIKVIYVTLAVLMGGGLVFFGIGGDVSGGLVDAITERNAGGGSGEERFVERERQAAEATRRNPQDAAAWAALARARFSRAGIGENFDPSTNTYTDAGKAKLRDASQAWEKYLALDPPAAQAAQVASIMVQAYSPDGLNQLDKAVRAQEIITEARPKSNTYAQLAVLAYQAGNQRLGDLSKERALDLADKDEREALRGQLEQAAAQAVTG
ncbi:MAG: hypothetical protein M3P50_07365, partial [Actinomycetota bacterium]|nr:hypothetical protein [Actinomycetota bacterium]